ncbi:hypothetical protein VTK73DRAFT_8999 [Phialemonium thermophilum]|uniref:Rhodopsin domain-containing protein n=1 Tax=Phialemonium thermophilum TaxID=223376 RepID=A0ABR3W5L3_9PEZI
MALYELPPLPLQPCFSLSLRPYASRAFLESRNTRHDGEQTTCGRPVTDRTPSSTALRAIEDALLTRSRNHPMADDGPAASLPPDDNLSPIVLGTGFSLLGVALATTLLRLCSRRFFGNLSWDDYTIAATAALAVARQVLQAVQAHYGNGRHRVYISESDYVTNRMLVWVAQILLFVASPLLKVSVCLLLLRVKNTPAVAVVLGCVMAGLVAVNLAYVVVLLAECSPVSAYWKGGGKCWNSKVRIYVNYFAIAYGILTDLICSLLPLLVLWKTSMPRGRKLMIWGLMSLGLLATGFGIARALSLRLHTNDITWDYCITTIWSNLELLVGITATNLSLSRSMWAFLRARFRRRRHSRNRHKPAGVRQSDGSDTADHIPAPLLGLEGLALTAELGRLGSEEGPNRVRNRLGSMEGSGSTATGAADGTMCTP